MDQTEFHTQLITVKTAPARIRLPTRRDQHTCRIAAYSPCHCTDMKQACAAQGRERLGGSCHRTARQVTIRAFLAMFTALCAPRIGQSTSKVNLGGVLGYASARSDVLKQGCGLEGTGQGWPCLPAFVRWKFKRWGDAHFWLGISPEWFAGVWVKPGQTWSMVNVWKGGLLSVGEARIAASP